MAGSMEPGSMAEAAAPAEAGSRANPRAIIVSFLGMAAFYTY